MVHRTNLESFPINLWGRRSGNVLAPLGAGAGCFTWPTGRPRAQGAAESADRDRSSKVRRRAGPRRRNKRDRVGAPPGPCSPLSLAATRSPRHHENNSRKPIAFFPEGAHIDRALRKRRYKWPASFYLTSSASSRTRAEHRFPRSVLAWWMFSDIQQQQELKPDATRAAACGHGGPSRDSGNSGRGEIDGYREKDARYSGSRLQPRR